MTPRRNSCGGQSVDAKTPLRGRLAGRAVGEGLGTKRSLNPSSHDC